MPRLTIPVPILFLLTAGCYSTTSIGGDAHTDTMPDSIIDTPPEPGIDTAVDPVEDTPPDVVHDTTPDGPSMCVPPSPEPDGPSVDFTIDDVIYPERTDIELPCTVASVSEEEGNWTIFLSCITPAGETARHKIDILVQPHIWLSVWEGEEVTFRYTAQPIWWVNRWFSLRYTAGDWLVVGGISAQLPTPAERSEYFSPLGIWSREHICEPEPGDCFDPERLALDIEYYDTRTFILDSNVGWVGEWGDYGVYVDDALAYRNMRCDDVPDGWFTALVFASGWD